ncbi:DDE_4 domain-containing protein, partial [Cephalotus follicularis]
DALNGTLVHVVIPTSQQTVYRGRRKGKCYQKVLGICEFNMVFTFVWTGWEGVAYDSRVLTEVMVEPSNDFSFPLSDMCSKLLNNYVKLDICCYLLLIICGHNFR